MSPGRESRPAANRAVMSRLAGEDNTSVPHRLPETPALDGMSADLRAFADGFSQGFLTGQQIGYAQGENAEARLWSEALGELQQADLTTAATYARRRAEDPIEPCRARCRRCSRCVRSVAFWRRGGRDYLGAEAEAAVAGAA